jgi:hypothetical protein
LQFLIQVDQGAIVLEQSLVNLGQTLGNGSIGSDLFTQPNKGPDHKDTHVDRPFAMENVGGHHGTVLGESPGRIPPAAVGSGHNL